VTEPTQPPPGPDPGFRRPWGFADVVVTVLTGIGASIAAAVLVTGGGQDSLTNFESFAVVGPAQYLGMLGIVALLSPRREPVVPALGLRVTWPDLAFVPAGFGLSVLIGVFLYLISDLLLGGEAPTQAVVEEVEKATGAPTIIGVVVTAVILAPFVEELVFRGILYRALLRRWGDNAAVYGSALVFAGMHVVLDWSAWLAALGLFGVGVVLAWSVRHSGFLGRAIMMHAGFNLTAVIAQLVVAD
jgi:membrane protease YdiL (CAAX protease family)